MTTKCHYDSGCYLLKQRLNTCTQAEGMAFLIGCVEPDINLFTYLKGSFRGQGLCRGHNYPNMLPCIEALLNKLTYSKASGLIFYYRLGKLTHYLMDAFTYPHNTVFSGTLQEHISYENMLEKKFLKEFSSGLQNASLQMGNNLYNEIITKHKEYLNAGAGEDTDTHFILKVVPTVIARLNQSVSFGF